MKGGNPAPLLSTTETLLEWWTPQYMREMDILERVQQGIDDGEVTGTCLIRGEAERAGTVQLGEERLRQRKLVSLSTDWENEGQEVMNTS